LPKEVSSKNLKTKKVAKKVTKSRGKSAKSNRVKAEPPQGDMTDDLRDEEEEKAKDEIHEVKEIADAVEPLEEPHDLREISESPV
jgi:hypothetical protein